MMMECIRILTSGLSGCFFRIGLRTGHFGMSEAVFLPVPLQSAGIAILPSSECVRARCKEIRLRLLLLFASGGHFRFLGFRMRLSAAARRVVHLLFVLALIAPGALSGSAWLKCSLRLASTSLLPPARYTLINVIF